MARYRKAIAAVLGAIAEIVALNVLTGTVQNWLTAILAVATALGVYTVPNAPVGPSAATTGPATGTPAETLPY